MSEFKKIGRIEKIFLQHKRKKGRRPPPIALLPPKSIVFGLQEREVLVLCFFIFRSLLVLLFSFSICRSFVGAFHEMWGSGEVV